jgi:hypothetical protein
MRAAHSQWPQCSEQLQVARSRQEYRRRCGPRTEGAAPRAAITTSLCFCAAYFICAVRVYIRITRPRLTLSPLNHISLLKIYIPTPQYIYKAVYTSLVLSQCMPLTASPTDVYDTRASLWWLGWSIASPTCTLMSAITWGSLATNLGPDHRFPLHGDYSYSHR